MVHHSSSSTFINHIHTILEAQLPLAQPTAGEQLVSLFWPFCLCVLREPDRTKCFNRNEKPERGMCLRVGMKYVLDFGFLGGRFAGSDARTAAGGVGDSRCGHFLTDGLDLQTEKKRAK